MKKGLEEEEVSFSPRLCFSAAQDHGVPDRLHGSAEPNHRAAVPGVRETATQGALGEKRAEDLVHELPHSVRSCALHHTAYRWAGHSPCQVICHLLVKLGDGGGWGGGGHG